MALTGVKKAHFIGLGGVGMSATAKLLKTTGIEVTGSDEAVYEPMLSALAREGLRWQTPYSPANIPADADIIVIGKNAKLVPETNAEVKAAYESGKKIYSFPEVLGELSKDRETIVVAGSYGKSTCAALLAHCLERAGLDPSYVIGAVPLTPNTSAKIGAGTYFVLEGDEYPSSNTDPRSKFLHFHPMHLLVTPLAHDHVNVFKTPEDYLKPFYELAQYPRTLVVCRDGPLSKEFLLRVPHATTYSFDMAQNISWGERTSFEWGGVRIETTLLGAHNVQNIIGAGVLLQALRAVMPEQFAAAVADFRGVKRRLERKSERTRIPIYEGFGSSYEKARSAIAAMKLHFPSKRLVIVFEPHTFSWRNHASLPWYDTAFEGAEKIYVYEPAEQGANTHAQLTQEEIVARVKQAGLDAEPLTSPDIPLTQNDAVLILTSGNLGGLIEPIIKKAEDMFPT